MDRWRQGRERERKDEGRNGGKDSEVKGEMDSQQMDKALEGRKRGGKKIKQLQACLHKLMYLLTKLDNILLLFLNLIFLSGEGGTFEKYV